MPFLDGTDRSILVPTALAGVVRAAHLAFLAVRDPLFVHPVVDAWFHYDQALAVIEKGWLLPGHPAFYKGPLLTYLFTVLLSFFGPRGGVIALHVVNGILGTLAVALAARLAHRLGGPRAAFLAGSTLAFYGTAVYYDGMLLQPPLLAVLGLAAADRLIAAGQAGSAGGAERAPVLLMWSGAFLGLLTITRGEGLLGGALAALWAAWAARRGRFAGIGPARAAALVAVPALLVVAPVAARNALVARDPVLVSWNGGINLFIGNDPAFDQGSGNWHPDLSWMRLYDVPALLGRPRGADHQRFFVGQSIRRAVDDPGGQVALLAHKFALLFVGYEISNNRRIYESRDHSPVLSALLWRAGPLCFPFTIVGPLIAAGLVLAGRKTLGLAAPAALLALSLLVVPVIVFHTARYRLPAIELLFPVAAAGWTLLSRPSARRALSALAAALAVLVTGLAATPARPTLPPSDTLNLGDVAEREGRSEDRLRLRALAVQEEPDNPMVRIRYGDALRTSGRAADALDQYRAVVDRTAFDADWRNAAMRSIARSCFDLRRFDEAVEWYRRFLDADPDRPRTGSRPDFHLRGAPPLQACSIRLELGRALAAAGRREEAMAETARVGADCPESEQLVGASQRQLRDLTKM